MQFSIATILALAASLTTATPTPQQGGSYVAVGNKYSGGGCTPQTLTFPDPIFGFGNVCQALDRFGDGAPIVSYQALSASAGCTIQVYSSTDCSGTAYSAPIGQCVQGNAPFKSVFVTCV